MSAVAGLVSPLFNNGSPRIYHSQQLVPVIEVLNTPAVYKFQGKQCLLILFYILYITAAVRDLLKQYIGL